MIRVLIVYDISDNRKRKKLSDYLKSKGLSRIQRSAYIGKVTHSILMDIERVIPRYIDREHDILHIFPITDYTLRYMKAYGKPLADIAGEEQHAVVTI